MYVVICDISWKASKGSALKEEICLIHNEYILITVSVFFSLSYTRYMFMFTYTHIFTYNTNIVLRHDNSGKYQGYSVCKTAWRLRLSI